MTDATAGLPGWPLAGCLFSFGRDPLGFLSGAARGRDAVWIKLGRKWVLLVTTPAGLDHVLRHAHEKYRKSDRNRLLARVMGLSVLTAESADDAWLERRRIVQRELGRESLPHAAGVVATEGRRLIADWQTLGGKPTDLERDMQRLTLNVIVRVMFGAQVTESELEEARAAIDVAMEYVQTRWLGLMDIPLWVPTPLNRRFKRALATLNQIVYRIIRSRAPAGPPPEDEDLLDRLLRARRTPSDRGEASTRFDAEEVRNEGLTIFLAGHETTAMTLCWVFDQLGRHPQVASRVRDEATRVLGGGDARPEHVRDLPTVRAVVNETLRLYPPVWLISRTALKDDTVSGVDFREGTAVWVSPYLAHRDPSVWAKADEFHPARWADDLVLPDGAFAPFGLGPRKCAGDLFALTELCLIVATIGQHFRVEPLSASPVSPRPLVTLRPGARIEVRPVPWA